MRIGLFGGTFNPIHIGHLRSAEEAREVLQLDRVWFVPSSDPPHKRSEVAPAEHRLAMVRRAIRGNSSFSVSTIEIDRPGRTYSIDTLRILRARRPHDRFVFLLGADAFREIATWKEYEELFPLADFAVFMRPPERVSHIRGLLPVAARRHFCYDPNRVEALHTTGTRVTLLNLTALEISASVIRQRLQTGQSIRYLVPPSVESYARRHGLYGSRSKRS